MIRQYASSFNISTGAFPGTQANLFDGASITSQSCARTAGATQIDMMPLQPPTLSSWSILGCSVSGYLGLWVSANGPTYAIFGRLSPVLAGFTQGQPTTGGTLGYQFVQQFQSLPADVSGIDALFDPATDLLPQLVIQNAFPQQAQMLPVNMSISFPQPITLTPGMLACMGVWIKPSLLGFQYASSSPGNLFVITSGLQYNLTYDDGG